MRLSEVEVCAKVKVRSNTTALVYSCGNFSIAFTVFIALHDLQTHFKSKPSLNPYPEVSSIYSRYLLIYCYLKLVTLNPQMQFKHLWVTETRYLLRPFLF